MAGKNQPRFVTRPNDGVMNENYTNWIVQIKQQFAQHQIKAALQVNSEMLQFYWFLGHEICEAQKKHAWGTGFLEQVSLDLREEFKGIRGFGLSNIQYIRRWYSTYSEWIVKSHQAGGILPDEIIYQAGKEVEMPDIFAKIPWRHHVEIATKCKTLDEAMFYIRSVVSEGWSRSTLETRIKSRLYNRAGKAISNFAYRLPAPHSQIAQEITRNPYNFDFLSMSADYKEKEFEDALINNITRFLLELGKGFAFVGRQIELQMPEGQNYYPDLVFYHTRLKCYVVIELKVVKFEPEFAGKLNFYVTAADRLLKGDDDNPSIGLLICKDQDRTVVEWSFDSIERPIGVATYEIQKLVEQTIAQNRNK